MGTITINTPPAQDPRIAHAVGVRMGFRDGAGALRDATGPEIKQFLIDYGLKQVVYEVEQADAAAAAKAGVTPITPT